MAKSPMFLCSLGEGMENVCNFKNFFIPSFIKQYPEKAKQIQYCKTIGQTTRKRSLGAF
jgi:hypothetical protein